MLQPPVNARFSVYSGSQTYNGLDENQRNIVENFENALTLRAVLSSQSPDEYLTGVERGSLLDTSGAFGHVYRGTWNKQNVAVKIFRDVEPPVFLIPSDTIHCLAKQSHRSTLKEITR